MPAPKSNVIYCESGRPRKWNDEAIEREADALEEWIIKPASPWFEDFALQRGYAPQRMSEFVKLNARFAEVYERAKAAQLSILVKGGITAKFNPSFTKFVMANVFGWYDKQESKISGDAENPLNFLLKQADGQSKDLVKDE